ncbi:hypothetical protein [Desulfovibrio gilichinskyi]|uniref:Uncharacterized protein n=1 Tax=Desulfovibrio gilichinskyi TaxID=1519643 RepID=A0A1X7CGD1_9BACT|nr:hypothetical protein [Desulfovibrio gilichinskyi]SME96127.1 hypothetical protein SAMN06295933_0864 [Desulfovibrio gilichinskyi]
MKKFLFGPTITNIIAIAGIISTIGFGIFGAYSSFDAKKQTKLAEKQNLIAEKQTIIAEKREIEVKQLNATLNGFLDELNITKNDLATNGVKSALKTGLENLLEKEGKSFESLVEAKHLEAANIKFEELISEGKQALDTQNYNAAFGFFTLANAYKPKSKEVENLLNKTLLALGSAATYTDGKLSITTKTAELRPIDQNDIILTLKEARQSGDEIECFFDMFNNTSEDITLDMAEKSKIVANGGAINIEKIRINNEEVHANQDIYIPKNVVRSFTTRFLVKKNVPFLQSVLMKFRVCDDNRYYINYDYPKVKVEHMKPTENAQEHGKVVIKLEDIQIKGMQAYCTILISNTDKDRKFETGDFDRAYLSNGGTHFYAKKINIDGKIISSGAWINIAPDESRRLTLICDRTPDIKFGHFKEAIMPLRFFGYKNPFDFRIPTTTELVQQ